MVEMLEEVAQVEMLDRDTNKAKSLLKVEGHRSSLSRDSSHFWASVMQNCGNMHGNNQCNSMIDDFGRFPDDPMYTSTMHRSPFMSTSAQSAPLNQFHSMIDAFGRFPGDLHYTFPWHASASMPRPSPYASQSFSETRPAPTFSRDAGESRANLELWAGMKQDHERNWKWLIVAFGVFFLLAVLLIVFGTLVTIFS